MRVYETNVFIFLSQVSHYKETSACICGTAFNAPYLIAFASTGFEKIVRSNQY